MEQNQRPYLPVTVAALLMWLVLFIIFPYYRFYIDPDGTSYLTISQRYADGDISAAINGLWSPWACWLTAVLIKAGMAAIPASVVINALGATGFLWVSDSLLGRFGISYRHRWLYCMAMVVFLCFAIFWQSFDDLWGCFFMLCVLRLILIPSFAQRPFLWVGIGLLGALAFFAKAYSLPYFMLCVTASVFFIAGKNKMQWLKIMVVAAPVMLLCCFPWIYALHTKYGIWTTSTAGPLNMSWYLVGHPEWKENIDLLLPPAHNGSVYYWEDPWYANGHLSHFWDSWHLMGKQVLRLAYNLLMLLRCMVELSVFMPFVGIYILYQLIKKFRNLPAPIMAVYIFFVSLPLGYIMVHLESRYLWLMLPLGMVIIVKEMPPIKSPLLKKYLLPLFVLSLMAFPIWGLKGMFNDGRAEYEFAQLLKAKGISGARFVSNLHPRLLSKIMYFSGNSFYVISKQKPEAHENKTANTQRLMREVQRYNISYYLYSPKGNGKLQNPGFDAIFYEQPDSAHASAPLQIVMQDAASGIIVYRLPAADAATGKTSL